MTIPAELSDLFARTRYVVEATHFESHALWKEFRDEYEWVHESRGGYIVAGEFGGEPVGLSCLWWRIDGIWVLFWEAVSQVVDNRLIDAWFKDNCWRERCNADNFHHCLRFVERVNDARKADGVTS